MNDETIARLNTINRQFYATIAEDFNQTRERPWAGWLTLVEHLDPLPHSVLDIGCGNARFGVFMSDTLGSNEHMFYHGIDNNPTLLGYAGHALNECENVQYALETHDVVENGLPDDLNRTYDLIAMFGVIHHIPGADRRKQFMQTLAQQVAPGGYLCFAAWRFYEYERFRKRLVDWDDDIDVETHDYLLDWRRGENALRYCHYVDEDEHAALIAASGLTPVTTYRADGSDGEMNRYSLLRRDADAQ